MRNGPTFLESFEPHIHANVRQASGPLIGSTASINALTNPTMGYAAQSPSQLAANQVQHFTYWNYVGIRLICDRASEPFPMLSYTTTRPAPGVATQGYHPLEHEHRRWLQQRYGWLQSAQEDLQPLPENHALIELLNNPNPEDTWNEFAYEHFMFLNLTGKVYWWVIPNGFGLPAQLIVIPTQWVDQNRDRSGNYVVYPPGLQNLVIPPDQIIESKAKSPRNKRDGYAPAGAAPRWVDNVENIEKSRHHSFHNGVNPDLLIKLGDKYGDPSDDVISRVKEKFMRRAAGLFRTGEPQVVPPGIELEKWSNTPKEMDYTTSGDQTRDNNLALHNVPKVLAGITTDVNRATVEAAEVVFCAAKVNPQLRHFAGTLTWLARRFDPRIRVWYQDVTPRNAQQELLEDQADFAMGAITPDERRQKRGRKPMAEPAYESGYIAAALHPLAEELNPEPEPDEELGMGDDGAGDSDASTGDGTTANKKPKNGKPSKPVKQFAGRFGFDEFDPLP